MSVHRYAAGFGGTCDLCGKQQHHADHFNGDAAAAAAAHRSAQQRNASRDRFRAGLQTGVRIQVTDDHPRDELAGRQGTVLSVTLASNTAEVLFEATDELQRTQLHLPIRYLDSPPLPKPPKFSSIEEAEAWMEQSAPEIGVHYPDLPPRFETVEEADEWLRQKAGEPYVPPSWQADADAEQDQKVADILAGAIAQADGTKPWLTSQSTSSNTTRGYNPSYIVIDEIQGWYTT